MEPLAVHRQGFYHVFCPVYDALQIRHKPELLDSMLWMETKESRFLPELLLVVAPSVRGVRS